MKTLTRSPISTPYRLTEAGAISQVKQAVSIYRPQANLKAITTYILFSEFAITLNCRNLP